MLTKNINEQELKKLRNIRWLARTDLQYLCNEILGYKDICREVHGPILDICQKFPFPPKDKIFEVDVCAPGLIEYRPWQEIYDLPGKRRRLILDPRSGLKTTINCIAHSIQWLLNFPWVTICIMQSTGDKAEIIMREIREHFQYNKLLRMAFPDLCPKGRVADWGNKTQFTLPSEEARANYISKFKLNPKREPSIYVSTPDKGSSGLHFDVIKFSDIVETNNSKSDGMLREVIYNFRMCEKLLVKPDSWMDVEGTRYHFNDLYGDLIEKWLDPKEWPGFRDQWEMHVRGCFLREPEPGKERTFTPDQLDRPFSKDAKGKRLSWWPVDRLGKPRWPVEKLEQEEKEDPGQFNNQRLNSPAITGDSYFPMDRKNLWIDRQDFWKVPITFHSVTVDTAETQTERSDFTAIVCCAWDHYGRCYVHDIRWGKFKPSEIIDHMFDCNKLYRPLIMKMEKTGFNRGFKADIERTQSLKNEFLPLEFLQRETTTSKIERIINTLQPWWKRENIRILTDLGEKVGSRGCKEQLVRELTRFPKGHDDILDALSDQFQDKAWFGRETERTYGLDADMRSPDPEVKQEALNQHIQMIQRKALNKFLIPDPENPANVLQPSWFNKTGGL